MIFKEFLAEHRIPTKVIIIDQTSQYTVFHAVAHFIPLILYFKVSHAEFSLDGSECVVYLECPDNSKIA